MIFPIGLNGDSRLMLFAPHPDDESLACSVILQRAVRAGAAVCVIYATDGDDNPWPQRVLERRWRIKPTDRRRWGKLRRSEALAALRVFGIEPKDAKFLALPDQGLTDLLRCGCSATRARLSAIIDDWSPTHLLIPSTTDTHPDHSALAVMIRLALHEIAVTRDVSAWSYTVHGKSRAYFANARCYSASEEEKAKKIEAILRHKSQIKLSRRRFLSYAARPERLFDLNESGDTAVDGPIVSLTREDAFLRIGLRLAPKPLRTGETALYLIGCDNAGECHCQKVGLPIRSGKMFMTDFNSRRRRGLARYRGNAFAGEFTIPSETFSPDYPIFVKVERRSLFFDEAGWIEVPPVSTDSSIETPQITRQAVALGR